LQLRRPRVSSPQPKYTPNHTEQEACYATTGERRTERLYAESNDAESDFTGRQEWQ